MRIINTLFALLFLIPVVHAQEKIYIYKTDKLTLGAPIEKTDSIYFDATGTTTIFSVDGSLTGFDVSAIDSINFGAASDTVKITFSDNGISVFNPFAFEGIEVLPDGNDVIVNSVIETADINYKITGSTTDGMLKIYSEKRFNLLLDGVSLANSDGPAINIQSAKKVSVYLPDGTSNVLADGTSYATSEEDQKSAFFSEGQLNFYGTGSLTVTSNSKHAICSDDYINIENGNITVSGASKDGIHAGDYFKMSGGKLTVSSTGDGIDCENGYVEISGGTITTNNTTADTKGIVSDSSLTVLGGEINITVSGNQSKGLKSGKQMTLAGGTISVTASGGVVLESSGSGYDPSYCTAVKADSILVISGSSITIKSTGGGGKGITGDQEINISSGNIQITTTGNGSTYKNSSGVTDSYNATCISGDENIVITGGTLTLSSSGTGGKGISSDGALTLGDSNSQLTMTITTTGSKFAISGSGSSASYAEAKAIKSDKDVTINYGEINISSADDAIKSETAIIINNGTLNVTNSVEALEAPAITVNGGNVGLVASDDGFNATYGNGGETNDGSLLKITGGRSVVSTTSGDGLDSNGNITMTGGTVIVHGPQSQPEVGADVNGTFAVSGGFLIVSGTSSNMTEGPSSSSSQYSIIVKTNTSNSGIFRLQDASGNALVTFKPARSYYSMVFSSADLKTGTTYSIYTGGTCTGTESDGIYTGGTYSGGSLKKSFSLTSKVTSVSF